MEKSCNGGETCKAHIESPVDIPFAVYESVMVQMRRLVWVIVLLIVLLVGSNIGWLIYESQFEDVEITQDVIQDAKNGENHFIGGDFVGTTESTNKS